MQQIPLNFLSPGELAQVGEILGHADQVHRLEELGLRQGTLVEMVQPGSPCIIRLAGRRVCFRADELTVVMVVPGVTA